MLPFYFADASLSEFGDATKPDGGFKLRVAKCNSVYYQNIPLSCFLDVELASTVGNAQESRLKMVKPLCCGLCSCLGVSLNLLCDYPCSFVAGLCCKTDLK